MSATDDSQFDRPRPLSTAGAEVENDEDQPVNLLTFLAVAQKLRVPLIPITWQATKHDIGFGGTSKISQTSLGVEARFAFKRVSDEQKLNETEDKIMRLLINELEVLTGKFAISYCIGQLQGVCWDVSPGPTEDIDDETMRDFTRKEKVWPALVFEATPCGDLYHFLMQAEGRALSVLDRMKLCDTISDSLAKMQDYNFIHGDIKPDNILIYPMGTSYEPKIIDFGYSTSNMAENDFISLPSSWPWCAPEYGSYDRFSLDQARKMDIFSLGMLCFWVIFEKYLSGTVPLHHSAMWAEQYFRSDAKRDTALEVLDGLKQNDQLMTLAIQLVTAEIELSDELQQNWIEFFGQSLPNNPEPREGLLGDLIERIRKSEFHSWNREIMTEHRPTYDPLDISKCRFSISGSFGALYQADYRLRRTIRQCLKTQLDTVTTIEEAYYLAFQLALCHKIGFGGPRDDRLAWWYLNLSRYDVANLYAEINNMSDLEHFLPTDPGPLYRTLQERGLLADMQFVDHCNEHGMLQQCIQVLDDELTQIEYFMGQSCALWLFNARKLVYLYQAQGLTQKSENLLHGTHSVEKDLVYRLKQLKVEAKLSATTEVETTLKLSADRRRMRELVSARISEGKWDDAIRLGIHKLRDGGNGEDDQCYPTCSNNSLDLGSAVGHTGLDKSEQTVLDRVNSRKLPSGEDHPECLPVMRILARICKLRNDLPMARQLEERIVQTMTYICGLEHPDAKNDLLNLAETFQHVGIRMGTFEVFMTLTKKLQKELGDEDEATLICMSILALTYRALLRGSEADDIERRVTKLRNKANGSQDPPPFEPVNVLLEGQPSRSHAWYEETKLDFEWILVQSQALPIGWKRRIDGHGKTVWFNSSTSTTSDVPPARVDALYLVPSGWTVHRNQEGRPFWLHAGTQTMQNRPPCYLPRGWIGQTDDQGKPCWYDPILQTTTYERPVAHPAGWEMRTDHLDRIYYMDHETNTKQWSLPPSMDVWLNMPTNFDDFTSRTDAKGRQYWVRHKNLLEDSIIANELPPIDYGDSSRPPKTVVPIKTRNPAPEPPQVQAKQADKKPLGLLKRFARACKIDV